MKSSSTERWIIQTYPPIRYIKPGEVSSWQDDEGWFCLKFFRGLGDHDFDAANPTVWKTLSGVIRRLRNELARGGLNDKWYYRVKNIDTKEVVIYDIL